MDNNKLEQIKQQLFGKVQSDGRYDEHAQQPSNVYAVIDGAATPELRFKLYDWQPQNCCLWSGKFEPDLEEVAPYLVTLQPACAFTDWLLAEGWHAHWNIFVETELDFKACRKHLRKFLQAKAPSGDTLIFRFYDPRVMALFAPNSDAHQAAQFYDNINAISYRQKNNLTRSYFSVDRQAVAFNQHASVN